MGADRKKTIEPDAETAPLVTKIFGVNADSSGCRGELKGGIEAWARAFFERWRDALKWQRLKPYETFAAMIERHWEGIAAYCKPENKVSLGVVEGLNNIPA